MMHGTSAQRGRIIVTLTLVLLIAALLYLARRALTPFLLGSGLAYILLPIVNWLDSLLPARQRGQTLWRSLSVLATYLIVLALIVGVLAFVIPLAASQVEFLVQRLPDLVRQAYNTIPDAVQAWLDQYQAVPEDLQATLQRSIENVLQSLLNAVQTGFFKTVGVLFSTLSFILGLVVVPLWVFYILRDQPRFGALLQGFVPPPYHEDARNVLQLIDQVLDAYVRGRLVLSLCMGIICTVGFFLIGVNFALLLGIIVAVFEIVPVLGPILGALPVLLVTLATSPANIFWVALLLFAAQRTVDYILMPLVARETVRLHPAFVMLVIVIGSAISSVWGVILSVPVAAIVRDIAHYLYLRLSDRPLSPQEALARLKVRT